MVKGITPDQAHLIQDHRKQGKFECQYSGYYDYLLSYNENSFVDSIMSVSLTVSYKTRTVPLTVSLKI